MYIAIHKQIISVLQVIFFLYISSTSRSESSKHKRTLIGKTKKSPTSECWTHQSL